MTWNGRGKALLLVLSCTSADAFLMPKHNAGAPLTQHYSSKYLEQRMEQSREEYNNKDDDSSLDVEGFLNGLDDAHAGFSANNNNAQEAPVAPAAPPPIKSPDGKLVQKYSPPPPKEPVPKGPARNLHKYSPSEETRDYFIKDSGGRNHMKRMLDTSQEMVQKGPTDNYSNPVRVAQRNKPTGGGSPRGQQGMTDPSKSLLDTRDSMKYCHGEGSGPQNRRHVPKQQPPQ